MQKDAEFLKIVENVIHIYIHYYILSNNIVNVSADYASQYRRWLQEANH